MKTILIISLIMGMVILPRNHLTDATQPSKSHPTDATQLNKNHLPISKNKPFKIINVTIYAYNAVPGQTDDSPNITASGYNISSKKSKVIANNCLPFGSLVLLFDTHYVVLDRMNKRYGCEVFDILMETYAEAKSFGKQNSTIKIYGY